MARNETLFNTFSDLTATLTGLRVNYIKGNMPKKTYVQKRDEINRELVKFERMVGLR